MNYLVKQPQQITADTQLLVLLHGYGSDENDLFSFTADLPENWLIVSLQAPLTSPYGGFCWYDIDFVNQDKFINVPQAENSLQLILNKIEEIKSLYKIEGKTNLCGFSQGGIISYALALRNPSLFKKVACLSSYPEEKILQNLAPKKDLQHLFFFISHGTNDAVVPFSWGQKATEFLYDLSVFFSFREYPSGHGLNPKNYQDLMEFFRK